MSTSFKSGIFHFLPQCFLYTVSHLTIQAEANYKNSLTELVTVRQLYNLATQSLDLPIDINWIVPDNRTFISDNTF